MVHFTNKQVIRQDYILSICKDKNVLNIGCLAANKKAKMHLKIEQVANSTYGMDIFDANIDNYSIGDVQNFNLNKKFDVVILGEVIEHLWDLKGAFTSIYKVLNKGGTLILTTPNAFAPIFLKQALLGMVVPNDQFHTLLFDITTLKNMLNNFASDMFFGEIFYYEENNANSLTYKIQSILAKINNGYSRGIIAKLTKV